MDRATVLALNEINRAFYRSAAASFSATRRTPWPGFQRVAEILAHELGALGRRPHVLDVGCGNGRFLDALVEQFEEDEAFAYTGLDGSPALVDEARRRHPGRRDVRLRVHDFVALELAGVLGDARFAAVALLAVLHHVPGAETRRRLLAELARRLEPGGVLALSLWRFAGSERMQRRVVPWERWVARSGARLDLAQLEPGDVLLAFGAGEESVRYCHALDDAEARALLATLPLEPLASFDADGEAGRANRYLLLRRPRP
jgi:tRNA (uracil-5-)-methyltransferase TRM9